MKLTEPVVATIKNAAKKLTGPKRRRFMAETTLELLDGSPTKAERTFGWGRETVRKGLKELETGIICVDNYKGRGNKKTEDKIPRLKQDIQEVLKPYAQVDSSFNPPVIHVKLTVKMIRQTLIEQKFYTDKQLPAERTFLDILKRLGYRLKRVDK
jgi:septum formation topological specificity factor MinE